jgi:hypothetical protein
MNKHINIPPLWDKNGPLPSLSAAVLLIGATSRLSHALLICASVLVVYVMVPVALRVSVSFIPRGYKSWIRIVFASAFAAVFARVAGLAWPLLVHELSLYIGMVPLCLISSGLLDRTEHAKRLTTLRIASQEAAVLCGLALAFALIREPFGFGSLSVPSTDGIILLFSEDRAALLSLRSVAATAGGFILLGYLLAVYRKISFRLYGTPLCGEDD